ncbi:hypothetical protein GCM10020258_52550 [Sphingomonas yabuuchiae]
MQSRKIIHAALPLSLMLALAACGGGTEETANNKAAPAAEHEEGGNAHADEGKITLSADQIASAGIRPLGLCWEVRVRSSYPLLSMEIHKARRSCRPQSAAVSCR